MVRNPLEEALKPAPLLMFVRVGDVAYMTDIPGRQANKTRFTY